MKRVLLVVLFLAFAGSAFAQTGTKISLSWVPSTSTSATGVNVYRSTVSGSSYSKVGTISNVTAGFDDTTGIPGTTYFYVVRSFDSFGSESTNSNQASATFPLPTAPLPPTNLTATPK